MNEKISDQKIVRHYLDRLESAILETKNKYGKLINLIAYNILCSKDDADECENDTYLNVWNSIPTNEPENLKAYCLRISRNLAIKRYRYNLAQKRDNSKQLSLEKIMEECGDIFPEQSNVSDENEIKIIINKFLMDLPLKKRKVFMLRYWYFLSVKEIMEECKMSKSQVEVALFRMRKLLKGEFEERGYIHG